MVPYVDAVVAVNVMRVLLFVLHVCLYVFGSGRRVWRGGEWMRGLGVGFNNPVGTGGVLDVCLCFWLRWCMWGVGRGLGPGSGGVGWCYVCARCKSGFSV